MSYEFLLSAPVLKEFNVTRLVTESYGVEELDSDGLPFMRGSTREVPVEEVGELPADRVRLSALSNDKDNERLFIRFYFGHLTGEGEWRPARLDDGLVISGPNYHEVDLDLDGDIEENEVLAMVAKLLKWEGDLVELATLPHEGEAQA